MKIIKGFLLCVMLCLSFVAVPSYAKDTSESEVLLHSAVELGILNSSAINRGDEFITRGEFIDALMNLMGQSNVAGQVPLSDVSPKSPYYASICAAYELGYIKGYADGTFRESEIILQNDAVRLLVYAVGYRDLIEGEMPVSKAARSSDICNFSESMFYKGITVSEAAELLINTGNAYAVSFKYAGDKGVEYYFEEHTVFEKYRDIHKITGIITANEFTCLNEDNAAHEGWVNIGKLSLKAGDSGVADLLGYNVVAYYNGEKNVEGGTVISAYADKNRVVEVNAKDIIEYNNDKLKYKNSSGRITSAEFLISEVDFIYNNKLTPSPKKEDFEIEVGNVCVIDNNNDGEYDVVKIVSYKTFVIDSVDKAKNSAYGKWGGGVVNFEKYDRYSFISENGSEMYVMELAEWDVLAVAESKDGKVMSAVYITGVVEGIISDYEIGNPSVIYIDGVAYEAADFFIENQLHELQNGKEGLFYLDVEGDIAAVNFSAESEKNFGYLMGIAATSSFGGEIEVKIMAETSEKVITKIAEKVVFNGKAMKTKDAETREKLLNLSPQLIMYKLDSNGYVKYIDTAYTENDSVIENLGEKENYQNSLCLYYDGISTGTKLQYRYTPKIFGGKVAASSNTLIFEIPPDPTQATDDDYWVYNLSYVEENAQKSIQAYKTNSDSLTADVIIFHKENVAWNTVPSSTAISVVDRVFRTHDEDDNLVYKVSVYTGKQKKEYLTLRDEVVDGHTINGEAYTLGVGDVIQITVDIRGKITNCKLFYSRSKDCMNGSNPSSSTFLDRCRVQRAFIYQKYKNNFLTTTTELVPGTNYLQSELKTLEMRALDNYSILRYDSEEKQMIVSGQNDLVAYVNSGNTESSKVVIYDRDGDGRTIVIYD